MSSRFADSVALAMLRIGSLANVAGHDSLEDEVIALFDEFREPLLRYLSSSGLAIADREDVIQETFLALFQHLQRGKSRESARVAIQGGAQYRIEASRTESEGIRGNGQRRHCGGSLARPGRSGA